MEQIKNIIKLYNKIQDYLVNKIYNKDYLVKKV